MHDTVVEMSAKRLGVVGVTDDAGYLVGVITDGDLRRNIERGLDHTAAEFMTRDPKTIAADALDRRGADTVRREPDHGVVRGRGRRTGKKPVGVLHIHDCPAGAMNTVILIPARYASTRYPGKPLVELKGAGGAAKPLIQRSVEAARRVRGVSGVFVDHRRRADRRRVHAASASA